MSPCSADEQKERMIGMTKRLNLLLEFVMLTLGAVIAAFAIEEFLVPNTILDGGVIGIGIMINNLTEISLSILTIVLNVPFAEQEERLAGWKAGTWDESHYILYSRIVVWTRQSHVQSAYILYNFKGT